MGTADVGFEDAPDIAADAALILESRRRGRGAPERRDRWSAVITGGSFLAVAVGWPLLSPPATVSVSMLIFCVAAYLVTASVEFEIGPGCALPTAPVQVVMLFALPPQLVPLAAVAGLVGAAAIGRFLDPDRNERMLLVAASGWPVVRPGDVVRDPAGEGPAWAGLPGFALPPTKAGWQSRGAGPAPRGRPSAGTRGRARRHGQRACAGRSATSREEGWAEAR